VSLNTRNPARPVSGALATLIIAALATSGAASPATAETLQTNHISSVHAKVALLLPSLQEYRWDNQDRPAFIAEMKALDPNAKVLYYNAEDSPANQLQQAQAAITAGAKVLVLSPVNAEDSVKATLEAKAANVEVISYARPIETAPISYNVGLNLYQTGVEVGKYWAHEMATIDRLHKGNNLAILKGDPGDSNVPPYMDGILSVLNPLAKSGKIHIVADEFTPNYSSANAELEMDQILTKYNDNVQAVLGLNDTIAFGVVAALQKNSSETKELVGQVPVSGGDASIPALQDILRGTMVMSTYFPIRAMADQAAKIAAYIVAGKTPPSNLFNSKLNNGTVTVPSFGVGAVSITRANIGEVISDGSATKAQICVNIPKGIGPC
jgi:D-xylose transport system substrate-binding protein